MVGGWVVVGGTVVVGGCVVVGGFVVVVGGRVVVVGGCVVVVVVKHTGALHVSQQVPPQQVDLGATQELHCVPSV